MLSLVNDILDFSQIESKTIELNIQKVSLTKLVQQCLEILQFQANKKNIELGSEIEEDIDIIETDQNRLK